MLYKVEPWEFSKHKDRISWCEELAKPCGNTLEELRDNVEQIKQALDKPILRVIRIGMRQFLVEDSNESDS